MPSDETPNDRRRFLRRLGGALAALPLTGLAPELLRAELGLEPLEPSRAHGLGARAPARAVIQLFMYGGPSQIDTFDHKPELYALDGKTVPVKTRGRGGARSRGRVVGPKWKFRPRGRCGKQVSELFPEIGGQVDHIAFVHSMYAESPIHGSALFMMNSGRLFSGHPSVGSWVTYGLGTVNPSMPGYVVMLDPSGGPINGAKNWSSGYMPASHQGVVVRSEGAPIMNLQPPRNVTRAFQRRFLDRLKRLDEEHRRGREHVSELEARIASYELAYRMQDHAPRLLDVEEETEETRALYGLGDDETRDFGRRCLLARRMVESGVRYVQVYSGGQHDDENWDAHGDLVKNHGRHARATDRPIAGLLRDLRRRGLLDQTLVVWGGEFGRQPTAEYAEGTGRDHNSYGFTVWLAGGGVKGGCSVGATDELGSAAIRDRFHVKNLHATILERLGLDPEGLSFPFGGLDQRLVGVEGAAPIRAIL